MQSSFETAKIADALSSSSFFPLLDYLVKLLLKKYNKMKYKTHIDRHSSISEYFIGTIVYLIISILSSVRQSVTRKLLSICAPRPTCSAVATSSHRSPDDV